MLRAHPHRMFLQLPLNAGSADRASPAGGASLSPVIVPLNELHSGRRASSPLPSSVTARPESNS